MAEACHSFGNTLYPLWWVKGNGNDGKIYCFWHGGSQSLHRKVEPVTLQLSPLWCRVPFCCFCFLLISSSATLKWVGGNRSQFLHMTLDECIVREPEGYGWRIQDSLNPSSSQEVVIFLTTACFIKSIIWDCWTVALWWRNSPLEEYISLFSCIFFMIYSAFFQSRSRKLFSILALRKALLGPFNPF